MGNNGLRVICVAWLVVFAAVSYWLNAFLCQDIANNGLIRDKTCMVFPPLLSCCYFAPAVILTMRRWENMTSRFALLSAFGGLASLVLTGIFCVIEGRI